MKNANEWVVPKLPFLVGEVVLVLFAIYLTSSARHPLGLWEWVAAAACVALGAGLGVLPFVLEYRATARLIEINGLETVAGKLQQLDQVAGQISACTENWTNAQTQAEKTAATARDIAGRMTTEMQQFGEFMQRMNDSEKAALRLEVEKLRRAEADWLSVLVRILDHVFALYSAAEHSGQPRLAEQIGQFQHACHDAARRVGLVPFAADPDELFNPERHQAVGLKDNPPSSAQIAETLGSGFKYQGKMIRPVLVRLREHPETPAESAPKTTPDVPDKEPQLRLEPPAPGPV